MGAPAGGDQDAISDINIVPLVDIILVVLIIFMVTAPTSQSSQMDVDLPSSSSGEGAGGEPFAVVITAEGRLLVNGEMQSEAGLYQLAQEAQRQDPQLAGLVTADKSVPHGDVVRVMDLLKSAGVAKLSVSTTQGLEE
mgnify:CR=1 FL=1